MAKKKDDPEIVLGTGAAGDPQHPELTSTPKPPAAKEEEE